MYTNCTFDAIRPLKYGYGFIGTAKTYKTRYSASEAEQAYQSFSEHDKKYISVFRTQKGHVFFAIVAHYAEPIWQTLSLVQADFADRKVKAKAEKKLAIAKKKLEEAYKLLGLLPPPPQQINLADDLPF